MEAWAARRLAQVFIDIGRAFCVLGVKNLAILAEIDTQSQQLSDTLRIFEERVGAKNYELSNHLGNVLATISDKTIFNTDHYNGIIYSAQLYYPFGWEIPTLSYTAKKYRFGFNGKEDDREWHAQDYGFRLYTPREGRFIGVDPITAQYPELTPYQFASNTPIQAVDLDGLEAKRVTVAISDIEPLTINDARYISNTHYPHYSTAQERRAAFGYAVEEAYILAIGNSRRPNGFYNVSELPNEAYAQGRQKIAKADALFKIVHWRTYPLRSATFYGYIDVKTSNEIKLTPQIEAYIFSQASKRKPFYFPNGVRSGTPLDAAAVGAASLILVTLDDAVIEQEVINYAQSLNVNIFQSKISFQSRVSTYIHENYEVDEPYYEDFYFYFSRPKLITNSNNIDKEGSSEFTGSMPILNAPGDLPGGAERYEREKNRNQTSAPGDVD